MTRDAALRCSFCGKPDREVEWLIAGPGPSLYICEECVELSWKIVYEGREKARESICASSDPGAGDGKRMTRGELRTALASVACEASKIANIGRPQTGDLARCISMLCLVVGELEERLTRVEDQRGAP